MINIEVWSDFVCPFCYIGKREFEKALEASNLGDHVNVTYKAFELSPDTPNEPKMSMRESMMLQKGLAGDQVDDMFQMTIDHAADVGLDYRFDNMMHQNTYKAHRLA